MFERVGRGLDPNKVAKMTSKTNIIGAIMEIVQRHQQDPDDQGKVVQFLSPGELGKTFEKRTGTSFALGQAFDRDGTEENVAESIGKIGQAIRDLSVNTTHNLFFNQLYGAVDEIGLAGELLSSALNTSAYTFEVAPVMTLMENEILRACYDSIGWMGKGETDSKLGGLMVPGGSVGNLYGINLARYHALGSDVLSRGNAASPGPLVAFCSQEAHYSFLKSIALIGVGRDHLVKVACDVNGAMLPDALDRAITLAKESGQVPFMVAATSGSTVVGAFDPLCKVAGVCRRHGNIWMHVDAAWGFPVIWSSRKDVQALMHGIEYADSVTWNPHKLLGAPLQATIFLTRHSDLLKGCHSTRAAYLFHPDQANASMDLGDLSLFCGRKSDVVKVWFMWKMLGNDGFGRRVDHSISLLRYTIESIQKNDRFILAAPPNALNVCFYVIPMHLVSEIRKEITSSEEKLSFMPPHLSSALDGVTRQVKRRLQEKGAVLIACQPISGQSADAFRLVIAGSREKMTESHIDLLLNNIVNACDDLINLMDR